MLRRVRGSGLHIAVWLLAFGWGISACGDESADVVATDDPRPDQAEPAGPKVERWAERLAKPTVAELLAALAQPHATVREHVGPHRLEVTSELALAPQQDDLPALHPPLDAPVVVAQSVHDELELRWDTSPDPSQARFALTQTNDHERGREVVGLGTTVHVRQAHRPWFHYERDSDIVELWLDDAQRSVHDAVQLAAPRLALRSSIVEGAGLQGGPAVEITLALAPTADGGLVAAGPTQAWRQRVELHAIEGLVRLDANRGAWLFATIDVRYRLPGADQRMLEGSLQLRAHVTPGAPAGIEAPPESRPVPARLRYDDEQRRLLDGLAAP